MIQANSAQAEPRIYAQSTQECAKSVGAIPYEGEDFFKERVRKCTRTRHLPVRNAARSSYSPLASRSFTQKEASRTSPSAANPAATLVKMQPERPENTSLLCVLPVAEKQEFRLSRNLTDLCIAAIALHASRNSSKADCTLR
jgi:hypothetical protein